MFTFDWFSNNIPIWEKKLKIYKNKSNLFFLEIGCFEGRATRWLLENILTGKNSRIVVIDTFDGGPDLIGWDIDEKNLLYRFQENTKEYEQRIVIMKGYSQEILPTIAAKPIFDFIYIDGSHIAKDVLTDAVLSWRLLKNGGILIFDDYGWDLHEDVTRNPKIAINTFLDIWKHEYKILHKGYQIIVQKNKSKTKEKKSENL